VASLAERIERLSSEERLYSLQGLPAHLADVGDRERFQRLLTDFDFMQAKVDAFGPEPLIEDYDLLSSYDARSDEANSLGLIQGALRLSSQVIAKDPNQFASQMVGRLLRHEVLPTIRQLSKSLVLGVRVPWLRLMYPTLHPPGTALYCRLDGHSRNAQGVALSTDGRVAVSGSTDKTLKVWDLKTGCEICTLLGHSEDVNGVAVSADGRVAVPVQLTKR